MRIYRINWRDPLNRPGGFGILLIPFAVFLAASAVWQPTSKTGWALEIAGAAVVGVALMRVLVRARHRFLDAPID